MNVKMIYNLTTFGKQYREKFEKARLFGKQIWLVKVGLLETSQ